MLRYIADNKFKLNFLNYKLNLLVSPIGVEKFNLPKDRIVHYNILNEKEEDIESFKELEDIARNYMVINNITKLKNPVGKVKSKNKNFTNFNLEVKKRYDKTKVTDKPSVSPRDLLVLNYNTLESTNRYNTHKLGLYHKLLNNLNTMVDNVNKTAKDFKYNVIMFNLPKELPSYLLLDRIYNKKMSSSIISKVNTLDKLLVLEFWKMFHKDTESVFNKIDSKILHKVYLTFTNNGYETTYNLLDLMGLSKENDLKGNMASKASKQASKLFLLSMARFNLVSKGITEPDPLKDDVDEISIDVMLSELGLNKDDVIEDDNVEIITQDNVKEFNNTETIESLANIDNIKKELNTRPISTKEKNKLSKILDDQLDTKFNIDGEDIKLKDILDYSTVNTKVLSVPMKKVNTIIDDELVGSNNVSLTKEYLAKLYNKDIYNAIYSIQNSNIVITDHKVTTTKSIMGEMDRHELELKPVGGKPSKVVLMVNKVDSESGTYKSATNEYLLRNQRMDLPIRKTDSNTVLLSTYTGKLFVIKSEKQKDNPSAKLLNMLVMSDKHLNVIVNKSKLHSVKLHKHYTTFSNQISRFEYNKIGFTFNYKTRMFFVKDRAIKAKLLELEKKDKLTYIGKDKDSYYLMSNELGHIIKFKDNKTSKVNDNIFELIDINYYSLPSEVCYMNVAGKTFPLVIILCYFIGLKELIKILKINKIYNANEKIKLEEDELVVNLLDKSIVIDRNNKIAELLFSVVSNKELSDYTFAEMSDKDSVARYILGLKDIKINMLNKLDSLETTFIDNISKTNLEKLKEPTILYKLLLRCVDLLSDDNYKNPNSIEDNKIVRYERIPGMINKVLANGVNDYNRRNINGNAKIIIDPYAVVKMMGDDSTSMLVSNLNPIDTIKQRDNVTFLGEFGRNKITMTVESRIMTPEEVGIISEATPDSGDSGISSYLAHNANIKDLRGGVTEVDIAKAGINKALSTANVISPFVTADSINRANFSSIQSSHVIPMRKMTIPRVIAGPEATIASKVGEPFVYLSKTHGVVTKKTSSKVTVKYTTPTKKAYITVDAESTQLLRYLYITAKEYGYELTTDDTEYKITLGKKLKDYTKLDNENDILKYIKNLPKIKMNTEEVDYSLDPWSTKEEGGESLKQEMATNLIVGSVLEPEDIITYSKCYFAVNPYDSKSLLYTIGNLQKITVEEVKGNYEDSLMINRHHTYDLGTVKYKTQNIILNTEDKIINVSKENDKVKYGDKILSIISKYVEENKSLSDRGRQILSETSDSSPKFEKTGKVAKVEVLYNCELEDMDPSIRELAILSDKKIKDKTVTGRVTNEFSLNGVPLQEGEILIRYLIEYESDAGIGDKFSVSLQLKNTIGGILDDIVTESGERIAFSFSGRSIAARITGSAFITGMLNRIHTVSTNDAIKAYRK